MGNGKTFIEVNYDKQWIENSIAGVQGFSWLYEWGMYIFLFVTLAILLWIFYDSITKKKDQKALVPRILSIIGFFAIIPTFIFRFTGTADGTVTFVKMAAQNGDYYQGSIPYNVNWLVSGYGPIIAVIALVGLALSLAAIVIYASSVQRAKPSTEFVNALDNRMASMENKIEDARRSAESANAAASKASLSDVMASGAGSGIPSSASSGFSSSAAAPKNAATIFDRKPTAATIIDSPKTNDTITVKDTNGRGSMFTLPANDVTIGRDSKNFIVVDDGKVSSTHLKLVYNGSSWTAVDLGSTNGTYLNGVKMVGQEQLNRDDEIKVGDTILIFGGSR